MTQTYHLAQINLGKLKAPMGDPLIQEFVDNLDRINTLGDQSPGWVWRLQSDSGHAMNIQPFEDPLIAVNMTVWQNLESLKQFTYKSEHVDFLQRRKEWFDKFEGPFFCMWWIKAGHLPTLEEAKERLAHLENHGETAFAFTFKRPFPPPN